MVILLLRALGPTRMDSSATSRDTKAPSGPSLVFISHFDVCPLVSPRAVSASYPIPILQSLLYEKSHSSSLLSAVIPLLWPQCGQSGLCFLTLSLALWLALVARRDTSGSVPKT